MKAGAVKAECLRFFYIAFTTGQAPVLCTWLFATACVAQADAQQEQPQRLCCKELAVQEGSLLHETRGFRQPHDPLVTLALQGADQFHETEVPFAKPKNMCNMQWWCNRNK